MKTQLTRSRTDRMLAGVCGGLATYLGVDAVWVRLFFVLITVVPNGIGILVYLILWIIMPEAGQESLPTEQRVQSNAQDIAGKAQEFAQNVGQSLRGAPNRQAGIFVGVTLILLGVAFLLNNFHWFWWLSLDRWWPLLLVVGGIALLVNRMRGE
jgi:phage shock protein C